MKTSQRSWYQLCYKLPAMAIRKAKILGNRRPLILGGTLQQTKIVGATLFAEEAHEVITIIANLGTNANFWPYTVLRDHHSPNEAAHEKRTKTRCA